MDSISELRQDIVSGDWVVIATGRAKRPQDFLKSKRKPFNQPKTACPFEAMEKEPLLFYSHDGKNDSENWWVEAIPNKFPAFGKGVCETYEKKGPYKKKEGVGFHEVVVTRDHDRPLATMTEEEIELVIRVFQERYLALQAQPCIEYISIFQNQGASSGASLSHPHAQIIAIPVVPPDIGRSLRGSVTYFQEHNACVHCAVIEYEVSIKERIIYENEQMVVLSPYATKSAFEMRILPKQHNARFETTVLKDRFALADALRNALGKLYKGLDDPDYNFFLHTAPVFGVEEYRHYHWHIEILPKTSIWAGFEIGTGIEISAVTPEAAAAFLRNIIL
ncbi:MAG: DUF4921 family protein [Candidatus Sungbacteria bacterium]|nr:DUF4921 family protein [Candidatus Sungbacteria bacterium]